MPEITQEKPKETRPQVPAMLSMGENLVPTPKASGYQRGFFLLLVATFFFRAWYMTTLALSGDEAYHWQWSQHIAAGYYDHPPMTAWMIWLATEIFQSNSEFTVRLPALLSLMGTAVVCYLFAHKVALAQGGSMAMAEKAGFLAGAGILLVPITAFFSMYISTDPPLIFFWSLSLYLLYGAILSGRLTNWAWAGAALGLALSSKLLAILLIPTAAAVFLISVSRPTSSHPRPKRAGVALAAALVMAAPFIWWNAEHDWATFRFNFQIRQVNNGISPLRPLEYVLGQLAALSPGIFLAACLALCHALRQWWRTRAMTPLFVGVFALGPVGYFFCVSFTRRVGIHWPLAGWISILVYLAASVALEVEWTRGKRFRRFWRGSIVLCLLMTLAMHLLAHAPQGLARVDWSWPGKSRAIRLKALDERYGWQELGQRVVQVREQMLQMQQMLSAGEGDQGVFVIVGKYGVASSVAFYSRLPLRTHLWSLRRVHGENYRYWDDFPSLRGQDAIYVAKRMDANQMQVLRARFGRVGDVEELPILVDGHKVKSFFLVRCHDFDGRTPYPSK